MDPNPRKLRNLIPAKFIQLICDVFKDENTDMCESKYLVITCMFFSLHLLSGMSFRQYMAFVCRPLSFNRLAISCNPISSITGHLKVIYTYNTFYKSLLSIYGFANYTQ